jgi:DNA-binding response OmpR family regulator
MDRAQPVIIVADDDTATLSFLQDVFADEGYATIWCRSEQDTIAHVLSDHPDLLIVDLRMETSDSGVRVVQRVRENQDTRRLPVIVCSADIGFLRERATELLQLGCDLLEKPFDLEDLLAKVAAGLSRARLVPEPIP